MHVSVALFTPTGDNVARWRAGFWGFVDREGKRINSPTRATCFFVFPFRNTPHQQVQLGLREHGGSPLQQICFKYMSTSCEAKCASFFWMHRLVSKMSADQLISRLQAKLICVSEGKRRDLTLLTCTLAAGLLEECGKENNTAILT